MPEPVVERMRRMGRDLYLAHTVSTRAGNLSVRVGDTIVITRTGALLGRLDHGDVIEVPVHGGSEIDPDASFDLPVHRRIYQRTDAGAVVHAHPPSTIAVSLDGRAIEPVDHEGRLFVPRVPVVEEDEDRDVVASAVADAMADGTQVVAVRRHGIFARGDAVEAATHWTTCLESSARILLAQR